MKAGTATITATTDYGKTAKTEVTVKKALLKDAVQTEYNKIKATITGDTSDLKAGDFKVTNKSTNATVAVKSVEAVSGEADKFIITTFTGMTDAKEYAVTYDGTEVTFTATDGTVAKVGIDKTEVPAAVKTAIQMTTLDANGVVLGYTDLDNTDSSKGKVTAEKTYAKGYVDGSEIYLPSVGDTMTVKVTYHTGTFGTDGSETGNIVDTFTITAVDPSLVTYKYAVTISDSAPAWKANSFSANTTVKIGAERDAYFYITDNNGTEISPSSYSDYSVEAADKTKLLVTNTSLASSKIAVPVNGVSEGTTYILIKKDGTTVASLPVTVVAKPVATTLDLSKTSVTVVKDATVSENVTATLKDQYGDAMSNPTITVDSVLGQPSSASATPNDIAVAGTTLTVTGSNYSTTGTYTYKIKATLDGKDITRTLTVNVVADGNVQAYEVKIDKPEVDTTIGTGSVTTTDTDIKVQVASMVNGGANQYVTTNVVYTVKDPSGNKLDLTKSYFVDDSAGTLTISPISSVSGTTYDKNLAAGTYSVTAEFADPADPTKKVTVGGTFKITDTQDTRVSFELKNNDFGSSTTVATAFADPAYVVVYYDGIQQTITSSDVIEVKGTALANGGAYINTVKLYVTVSGSSNKVPVTITVNDQIASCDVTNIN